MPKRFMLAMGLLTILVTRTYAQEAATPPNNSAAAGVANVKSPIADTLGEVLSFVPLDGDRWFTADFLFGWIEGAHLPPLVTTSPVGTDQSVAGILADGNDTSVLLSGTVNRDVMAGFRLGGGYIYDPENGLGVEGGFLFLPSQSTSFAFSSDNNSILARPYNDATTLDPNDPTVLATPEAVLVAFPTNSTGTINVHAKSGNFYAANFNLTERISDAAGLRIDALFGYRFAAYSDSLRIRQSIAPDSLPGTTLNSVDDFSAQNTFNGLDLGFRGTYSWNDRLSLNLLAKASPGNMHHTVRIRGRQVTSVTGSDPVTAAAGVYALESNIGRHSSNDWTVLPEAGANLNWRVRSNVSMRLGYSLLYLTKVTRADNQIDFNINPNLFPPADPSADPRRPTFPGRTSDLWIQTLNLGVDVTF